MKALREHTFTWDAPHATARAIFGRDHLTWLREMKEGIVPSPPAARAMGFTIETVEPGHVAFSMRTQEWMANPTGVLHGGLTSTLLDTVLTLAVTTQLPVAKYCTTIDLHVHFVRGVVPDGEIVVADGWSVHVGGTIATAEARVHDEANRLIAHATATFAVLDQRPR